MSIIVTENETIFCIKCRGSIECCFCSCPYCGEINDDCCCKLEKSKNSNKILPTKYNSKHGLLKQSKTFSFVNRNDDDWWRLEKWHIGRRNFP